MKHSDFATRRKVGSAGAARLASLTPVVDPHFRAPADHDEAPPACPDCGSGETWWFVDRRTAQATLVCRACLDAAP